MIERFRELTTKQKVGAIALVFAFIGFVIFFVSGLMNQPNEPKPEPTETTQSAPATTDEANPEEPTSDPSPSPSESEEASSMPAIEYGAGDISNEESLAAQNASNTAIEEFLKWNPGETREERKNRISAFIVSNSAVKDLAPDLKNASTYENIAGKPAIASLGTIDYINAVGGDESRYRVTMGIVLRMQYNYDEDASQKSSVVQESSTISVDMAKENGTWKILEISNS